MSKMSVVMYKCDGCKKTGEPAPYPEHSRVPQHLRRVLLPEEWVELRGIANGVGEILNLQFCADCMTEVTRLLTGMTLDDHGIKPIIDDKKKEDK